VRTEKSVRPTSQRLTLSELAKASGFSPSTVSIVLNEAPLSRYVAASTKLKIRETAQRLGYRPNVFARSLRSSKTQTIGVLVIDLADPFCTLILQGIEGKLRETPYLPIIMDAHSEPAQVERYIELMMERRVDGLITVANWLLFDISVLEHIGDGHLPTVVVGRDVKSPSIHCILVDNAAGGYSALRHLYELGHREIAIVCGPRGLDDSSLRWKGIRRFAKSVKLRLNPALVKSLPAISESASSFEGSRKLIHQFLDSRELFSAVLAFDDISAYGAIRALSERNLRVPDDVSVIGFDDIPTAAISTPSLTTIRQPMVRMGEFAAECVLTALKSGEEQKSSLRVQTHLLPAELVSRGSTVRNSR
jgi:DNA-binding LacI/PurR family transcriptional regulator